LAKARLAKIGVAAATAAALIVGGTFLAIRESTRPKRPRMPNWCSGSAL
jgi:hypothetical protein